MVGEGAIRERFLGEAASWRIVCMTCLSEGKRRASSTERLWPVWEIQIKVRNVCTVGKERKVERSRGEGASVRGLGIRNSSLRATGSQ